MDNNMFTISSMKSLIQNNPEVIHLKYISPIGISQSSNIVFYCTSQIKH